MVCGDAGRGSCSVCSIMLFLNSVRVAPGVRSVLAVACGLTLSGAGMAQVKEARESVEPVVVTATRQDTRVSEVLSDVTVIDSQEIRQAGPTTTLAALLGRQPGIEFTQNGGPGGSSSVFIRGSNSNHVLLLVDGVRVGSVTTGSPTWEYMPLEQIDHIEIVRGPASSLYGSDAMGGVIQIFTKRGEGPFQPFVEAGYGTYNTSALSTGFSGSQDGLRYGFQVSNKHSDSFSAITNPTNPAYNPDKDGYRTTASSGNLSYSPAKGHEFGVNFMYADGWSRFDSGGPFSTPASDDYKQKETISSVNLYSRNQLTDIWTSTVRIGQSSDDSRNLDNGVRSSFFRSTQTQYQWQSDFKLPVGTALLGVERLEQRVDSDTGFAVNKRGINSILAGWSGHVEEHTLQVNVRQDNNSQFGDKATGMLAYGYQLASNWRAGLSWGSAFKAPTFNDLYYPADAYGDVSNPNLKPETAVNREASLHYEATGLDASITYYQNDVKNLIQWAPIDPTFVTTYGYTPSNVASATLTGWTLASSGKMAEYKVSGSLDLQDPKDDVLDKTLIYRARKVAKFAVSRDIGNMNVGGEVQAYGRRFVDTANTQALAGYSVFNLTASYRVTDGLSVFARANNVFDKKYVLVKDFATPGASLFVGVRYVMK
ncbi:MAG: TonB-dependent receptor [Burkholderiales bacterium]|nr:MAG: TonB-dependent receptor [Burkholderiales bacterium]